MSNRGKIWNSKKIADEVDRIERGLTADYSPFFDGKIDMKAPELVYEYTREELEELARCANDVVYFGNKYCYSMTDEGIRQIALRPYQEDMLAAFQDNRFVVMLASRQIGKTVTSSIFIAWYLCFHSDRNIMVVANKLATTSEIVDKIKTVLKNLPFFMKPGITAGGVTGMRFDNGCRLFSQATTKTAAIGFTIHLLFADEFAHIHSNFLLPFYRSIDPTLASSQISRIIICSTPNGMNLFYEIYQGAIEHKNSYFPIRVDWWQVPGRDEVWKAREIGNLGSEELFNQEYGNQFLASSRLLFDSHTLMLMKRVAKEFVCKETDPFLDYPDYNNNLRWLPTFDPGDAWNGKDKYVFAVDVGDGVGRDYSVINIFNVVPQSVAAVRKTRDWEDETSFFRLNQVGVFRSNMQSVEELAKVLELLVFELFEPENCKIVLEINFKGNIIFEKLSKNPEFFPEIFLYTRHSMANPNLKMGVKMQKDNRETFCRELRNLVKAKKITVNEKRTFDELSSFGISSSGRYESQLANDDIAMTCVNLVSLFDTTDYFEMVEDKYDNTSEIYKLAVEKVMSQSDRGEDDFLSAFKTIKSFESPTPYVLPKDAMSHNYRMR
jgi:hypothetical protein